MSAGPNVSGSKGNVQTGATKMSTPSNVGAMQIKGGVTPKGCGCTGTARPQVSGSKGG